MMKKDNDAPAWPVEDDGQKARGVELLYAKNPVELDITQSLLHAYGIPTLAHVRNQAFFSTVVFGSPLLGAAVYVPETRLEEARALLEAQVEEIDESEDT